MALIISLFLKVPQNLSKTIMEYLDPQNYNHNQNKSKELETTN